MNQPMRDKLKGLGFEEVKDGEVREGDRFISQHGHDNPVPDHWVGKPIEQFYKIGFRLFRKS